MRNGYSRKNGSDFNLYLESGLFSFITNGQGGIYQLEIAETGTLKELLFSYGSCRLEKAKTI